MRIPFEGKEIVGYLRLPKGMRPAPLVLTISALDSRKEDNVEQGEHFIRRGIAFLALDMPGTGEAPLKIDVGADWGLKTAVDQDDIPGPRLFIAGAAIGPTGGHSDPRRRTDFGMRCHCCDAMRFGMRGAIARVPD